MSCEFSQFVERCSLCISLPVVELPFPGQGNPWYKQWGRGQSTRWVQSLEQDGVMVGACSRHSVNDLPRNCEKWINWMAQYWTVIAHCHCLRYHQKKKELKEQQDRVRILRKKWRGSSTFSAISARSPSCKWPCRNTTQSRNLLGHLPTAEVVERQWWASERWQRME